MTGIERLVDIVNDGPYSGGMIHISVQKLREICEQIESETVEALAFVREHGGLDEVKKRLMPEGMEWPTVDGKPIDFVTGYEPSLGVLEAVSIYSNGACEVMGHDGIIKYVGEIHVATPKVLDADGVEIRVGDTVYQMGCKYRVSHLHGANGRVRIVYENSGRWVDPKTLTHRAPVLAADGRPLREGETVWSLGGGGPYTVAGFGVGTSYVLCEDGAGNVPALEPSALTHRAPVLAADGKPLREGETVWDTKGNGPYSIEKIEADGVVRISGTDLDYFGNDFVHERPDSWERWIEDADKSPCEYFGVVGPSCDGCRHDPYMCDNDKDKDLVSRAKALAERGK